MNVHSWNMENYLRLTRCENFVVFNCRIYAVS